MNVIDYLAQTTPPTLKLSVVQGDTFSQTITVRKSNFDFTGTTARCHIKRSKSASTALAEVAPLLTVPALGILTATLQVDYSDLTWRSGTYYADLELTFPGNTRKTVAFLEIEVIEDVTD